MEVYEVPFDPEKVPYRVRLHLPGARRPVLVEYNWNYVGGYFTFAILDEKTGELRWKRPMLYGLDLLLGCTLPELWGWGIVVGDWTGAGLRGVTLADWRAGNVKLWAYRRG
ncbi:MAG: hypothetical protein QXU79_00070 [Candidatus Micrarchaeaceae archaeon]